MSEADTQQSGNPPLHCAGFRRWTLRNIWPYLKAVSSSIHLHGFEHSAVQSAKKDGGVVIVWASRLSDLLLKQCETEAIPLWRIEDGFLRSVGLGSNFDAPWSLVIDKRGIYYDPNRPSDLEHILNQGDFSEREKEQAQTLMTLMTQSRISKYNLDQREAQNLSLPQDKKIIFIPGQVARDASIRLGCIGEVKSNAQLIEKVRQNNPEAFLIYKPHPDVVAGNRPGHVNAAIIDKCIDLILPHTNIHAIFDRCHEVHTLTSLVGFEGLLRGKDVHCYGAPFYAGWGVTHDMCKIPRRTAQRNITDLVIASLIRYPLYYDWKMKRPSGALEAAKALAANSGSRRRANTRPSYILTQIGRLWRVITNTLLSYRLK